MAGETSLSAILDHLEPELHSELYVFCTLEKGRYGDLSHTKPLACFAEAEGLTLVMSQEQAVREGLRYHGTFRCIHLNVHSSLEAVGLTAAVGAELAKANISANMYAGYYHDHVFVPAEDARAALECLQNLRSSRTGSCGFE
jgi:hypothetical protein